MVDGWGNTGALEKEVLGLLAYKKLAASTTLNSVCKYKFDPLVHSQQDLTLYGRPT
jgi:hypothetical protein